MIGRPTARLLFAASALTAVSPAAGAAETTAEIPQFASRDFGWQSNVADWQNPPAGMGHGPINPDPAHPFMSNAEGARLGKQPTLRIGNARDPVLKPWAAKEMAHSNEEALTGGLDVPFAAQARCYPGGVPGQLLYPFEPMYFAQTPTDVWMFWQRDHMVRHVYLNRAHSKNIKPSWFGESVGHYENGNTLVVDTIGLSTRMSFIDNFRTPHTIEEHVIERFTIEPDGQHIDAVVTVEDPETFNAPLHMSQRWFKVNAPMAETVCAENNNDNNYFHQKLVPIPQADLADF
jgi:hypothetical protein